MSGLLPEELRCINCPVCGKLFAYHIRSDVRTYSPDRVGFATGLYVVCAHCGGKVEVSHLHKWGV